MPTLGGTAGGKGPSVTTTALVAPSAERAFSSTRFAASAGSSASVSEPLSAASARRRWLAPEIAVGRGVGAIGGAGIDAVAGVGEPSFGACMRLLG